MNIPVIAGGGIGDARGFVAALALGAEGVVMGTRFMVTKESLIHQNVKETIVNAKEADSMSVLRSLKAMERVFRNEVAEKVIEMENKGATLEELVPLIAGTKVREALEKGNMNVGILPCGQVTGLINEVLSVKEVIDGIVDGARDILDRLTREIKA